MSKKGENIYKRKDGRWEGRYIKAYTPEGKAKYGYCYGKTYREVREKVHIARMEHQNKAKMRAKQAERRLSDCCDEWLQLKRSTIKQSTYVKYQTIIEQHIKPGLGSSQITSLTSLSVEQFSYDLIHQKKLSPKTTKDILIVLHAILAYARKQLPNMLNIEVIYPKEEKKEMRVLTRAEQEQFTRFLLEDIDNCKFGILFTLLTGLRVGEVCALKWKDIELDEGLVDIHSTMQRIKNYEEGCSSKTKIVISDPKSFSSARIIPLSPLALKLCKQFYGDENAYLLTGNCTRYMEPRTLQYHMARYVKECGLTGVHLHTLRHSFATRCVEVGFEIKSLSEVLGHASPQITLNRYVHSSLELKRENIKKLTSIGY